MSRRFAAVGGMRRSFRDGNVAAVSPLNRFGNVVMPAWYRSDLGITIGTGVSQWSDQSGRGNHIVQATAGLQPTYGATSGVNGRPGLTCAVAAKQFLSKDSGFAGIAIGSNPVILAITTFTTVTNNRIVVDLRGATTSRSAVVGIETGSYLGLADYTTGGTKSATRASPSTAGQRIKVSAAENAMSLTTGAATVDTTAGGTGGVAEAATRLAVGRLYANETYYHDGVVSEVMMFSRALTADENAWLVAYINGLYALGITA